MDILLTISIAIGCLILGGFLGFALFRYIIKQRYNQIIKEAEIEAEALKEKKQLELKEKFLNRKSELDKEANQRNQKMQVYENKLKQRELTLNQQSDELQKKQNEVESQRINLTKQQEKLDSLITDQRAQLETISGLTTEEARESLIESLKDEAKTQAQQYINEIMDEAKMTANKEAKKIVIQSIQRVASETAVENSVSVFHIESDEVKGRVIGREGRNIRALEAATGTEIVVDNTPEAIVISAFDPIRREICRLALHQLVADGRIHPARIEEVVAKVKKQVEDEIVETGKRTCIDMGVHGLHPELVRIVGKMKYRSSYGQNLLQHARDSQPLCGDGCRTGAQPQEGSPCWFVARHRQGARRANRDSTRPLWCPVG